MSNRRVSESRRIPTSARAPAFAIGVLANVRVRADGECFPCPICSVVAPCHLGAALLDRSSLELTSIGGSCRPAAPPGATGGIFGSGRLEVGGDDHHPDLARAYGAHQNLCGQYPVACAIDHIVRESREPRTPGSSKPLTAGRSSGPGRCLWGRPRRRLSAVSFALASHAKAIAP